MNDHAEVEGEELSNHSMILTGFGYYIFDNGNNDYTFRNFWEVKNSMGVQNGVDGYIHFLSSSSQDNEKYYEFDPIAPLSLAKGERYEPSHLVKEMSLVDFENIESDIDYDIVVMFYRGDKVPDSISTDFRRASRFYLKEKDAIFAEVNVTGKEEECAKKYRFVWQGQFVVRVYRHEDKKEGRKRKVRRFNVGQPLTTKRWTFDNLINFLFKNLG